MSKAESKTWWFKLKCLFGFHKFKKTAWTYMYYCSCGEMRCYRDQLHSFYNEENWRREFRSGL